MEFANYVYFIDDDKKALKWLLPNVTEILKDMNLFTNTYETEFTNVYLSNIHNLGDNKASLEGDEGWIKRKILGSKICSSSDIMSVYVMGTLLSSVSRLYECVDRRFINKESIWCSMFALAYVQMQQLRSFKTSNV